MSRSWCFSRLLLWPFTKPTWQLVKLYNLWLSVIISFDSSHWLPTNDQHCSNHYLARGWGKHNIISTLYSMFTSHNWVGVWVGGWMGRQAGSQAGRQAGKHAGRQASRQAGRQAGGRYPHFEDFQYEGVRIISLITIQLTLSFCRINWFVSITFSSRDTWT